MRYWQPKVFKPWYTRNGERREVDHYAVKIQYRGRRENINLGTPNRTAAAGRARDFYVALMQSDWTAALARLGPAGLERSGGQATVGEFLRELEAKAELRPKTFEGYAVAFRKIVGDIFEIEGGRERYDYQRGGRERWIARINSIELAEVTPGKVQEWKRSFLGKAGTSHSDQRTARISVNSLIRRAKSLFSAKAIRHLERVKLPNPLPFHGIEFEKRQSMRYRSSFDVFGLIEKARGELAEAAPEQFKIFLLAVMAGLRRNEIDKLEWPAFRWKDGVIRDRAHEVVSSQERRPPGRRRSRWGGDGALPRLPS